MRIIVDVMSGDHAPLEMLKGTCLAASEYNANFILVGNREIIESVAEENQLDLCRFEIIHTETVIDMNDDPLCVVRAKNDSSMSIGLRLLADGQGDAFVSCGNTGALFTGATLIVRKIRGIQRAALASVIPVKPPVLLLDCGANVQVTEEYLEQFAIMGSIYMKKLYSLEEPRVGLINNGAEETKGTPLQQAAYARLSACERIHFVGNIEANQIPFDACDVAVSDGFTGNVLLKNIEGLGKMFMSELKNIFYANSLTKVSALMMKKQMMQFKHDFDSTEHGGAPLLGISRPVIKAHGSSNAKAFKNAIRQAINFVNTGILYDFAEEAELFLAKKKSEAAMKREAAESAGETPDKE